MAQFKIGMLLLVVGMFFCTPSAFSRAASSIYSNECDSLFLSNGKAYAVKNLVWNESEVSFSFCADSTHRIQTAPWMQIHHLKKSDGQWVDSPLRKEKAMVLNPVESQLEQKVNNLYSLAVLALPAILLFGLGFILAFIVLVKGNRLKKALIGHPKEKTLLKRIKKAQLIAKVMLLSWLFVGLIGFGYLIYFFSQFGKIA